MMMWQGIDQRKFPRANYKCLIRIAKEEQEDVVDTLTENIGAGGICVVLEKDLGLFETVSLEVHLGDGEEPISCNGTIVWVVRRHPTTKLERYRYDTGIEFADISDTDRGRVSRLVDDIIKAGP